MHFLYYNYTLISFIPNGEMLEIGNVESYKEALIKMMN